MIEHIALSIQRIMALCRKLTAIDEHISWKHTYATKVGSNTIKDILLVWNFNVHWKSDTLKNVMKIVIVCVAAILLWFTHILGTMLMGLVAVMDPALALWQAWRDPQSSQSDEQHSEHVNLYELMKEIKDLKACIVENQQNNEQEMRAIDRHILVIHNVRGLKDFLLTVKHLIENEMSTDIEKRVEHLMEKIKGEMNEEMVRYEQKVDLLTEKVETGTLNKQEVMSQIAEIETNLLRKLERLEARYALVDAHLRACQEHKQDAERADVGHQNINETYPEAGVGDQDINEADLEAGVGDQDIDEADPEAPNS